MKIFVATSHSMESNPFAAAEKPKIDATISWVVETGIPNMVAMNNIMLAENNAENIPNIRTAGSSLYNLISMILERIVPVTDAPRKNAPENSKTDAITIILKQKNRMKKEKTKMKKTIETMEKAKKKMIPIWNIFKE